MNRKFSINTLSYGFLFLLAFGPWGCSEFKTLFDPNETHNYFKSGKYPFQSNSRTSEVNVAWLADASMLAYCDDAVVKREFKKIIDVDFQVDFFKQTGGKGTQGIIASDKEKILVIFRGTEIKEIEDILFDFDFRPSPEGGGNVHKGFKDALDAVWDDVSELLQDLQRSGERPVWFTGHSLGGAIAVIAAGRWKAVHKNQRVSLYTYGAPGVGNKDYISNYPDINVVRVIDNEDLVGNTEHKGPIFDLEHPGEQPPVQYTRPPWVIKKRHEKLPAFLADHAPIYYAESSWLKVRKE